MSYEEWQRLKPLAMRLIKVFDPAKLMYYDEINKCGEIIEVLHEFGGKPLPKITTFEE